MTPQALKSAILQLAIQGKLVPQRPEDGVARVPAALNTEKRKARRHGEEMEPPFDIPASWRWVRLGDVASIERGSGIKRSETSETGFPCVRYGEIYTTYSYSFTQTQSFVPENVAASCHIANHGDVLCTLTGEWKEEIAKATAYLGKDPIAIGGDLAKISSAAFHPVLLVYFFFSPFMIEQKAANANGTMIVHIGKSAVEDLLLPLPPLPEQHRIVAKIEELLPLIDRYEQAWTKLEDFNRRFPADMQKSLLQLAIQGKLVEQRPEEGTGEQLYRKILDAKKSSSSLPSSRPSSRLKSAVRSPSSKQKPLPPITEDEIPFDIPESWKWVRFGELGILKNGYAFKSSEYTRDGLQIVRISDLGDDSIGSKDAVYYPSQDELTSYFVVNGSFLICMTGSIGKMAWVKDGVLRYLNQRVGMFVPNALCSPDYLWYFLHTNHVINGWIRAKTSANGNIKNSDITDLLTPLPPLAEQKRIVAKLEELLPLCERLK